MRTYYLLVAVAASIAALAMATQLHQQPDDEQAEVESEMEAWFI